MNEAVVLLPRRQVEFSLKNGQNTFIKSMFLQLLIASYLLLACFNTDVSKNKPIGRFKINLL